MEKTCETCGVTGANCNAELLKTGHCEDWIEKNKREAALEELRRTVCVDRETQYGKPEDSFDRIACYWSTYLNHMVLPQDVAMMMVLLKVARQQNCPKHDNALDIAGYALCAIDLE